MGVSQNDTYRILNRDDRIEFPVEPWGSLRTPLLCETPVAEGSFTPDHPRIPKALKMEAGLRV